MKRFILMTIAGFVVLLLTSKCQKENDSKVQNELQDKVYISGIVPKTPALLEEFYEQGWTVVKQKVEINSVSGLTDLHLLSNVRKIEGDLIIEKNPDLRSLRGLENLDSIGGDLVISGSFNLSSITLHDLIGIENLLYIGGHVRFYHFPSTYGFPDIKNLNGDLYLSLIGNAEDINVETIGGALTIKSIDPFTGLHHLKEIGNLSVYCDYTDVRFTYIDGLESLTTIKGGIMFYNTLLSNIDFLSKVTSGDRVTSIHLADNMNCKDWCGFMGIMNSGFEGTVTAEHNRYNPTYEQLKNGECSIH